MRQELVTHLDVKVEDPRVEALFKTLVETTKGLVNAFSDFKKRNEEAWREA